MRYAVKRYKLYTVFFILCLISSSRFWEISSAETVEVDSLPIVVLFVRIIPLLIILGSLFFDDLLYNIKGLLGLKHPLFFALGFYLLVSFYSSLTYYGEIYSAWKTTELIIITYLGAHMISWVSKENLLAFREKILHNYFKVVLVFGVSIIISSLLFFDVAFRFGTYQMEAIFPPMNPNALGFFSLGSLVFFIFVPFKNQVLKNISRGLFLVLYILSLSRTAYISGLFILGLFVLRSVVTLLRSGTVSKLRILMFSVFVILAGFFINLKFDAIIENVTKGQSGEELAAMSHRVFIWQASILSIKQNPYLGYGLVAETRKIVEKYPDIVTYNSDSIGNVHSTIFESLLASGIIGAGPFLLILLFLFLRSCWYIVINNSKSAYNNIGLFACCFIITLFFRSLTGSALTLVSFEFVSIILVYSLRCFPWQINIPVDE